MNVNGDDALGDLPASVAQRVLAELSDRGPKVLAALRTAAALMEQAVHDEVGLRLAESAAYNVREALDAVVAGHAPVQDAIGEAWRQFELEVAQPGNDLDASLEAFRSVMRAVTERQNRISYQEARLLGYLRGKTGVDPLPEQLSPLKEYRRLRQVASTKLHQDTNLDSVSVLYQDTIAWFVRMFTPPDTVVLALRELALEPWQGPGQIARLQALATNPHHLRQFFTYLRDPAWLGPLYDARVIRVPDPPAPWPLDALVHESMLAGGAGNAMSAAVAAVLQKLFADSRNPGPNQLDARFALLRVATRLGPDGHRLVGDIAAAHPNTRAVKVLAAGVVKRCDPAASVVLRVGRVVLDAGPHDRDTYNYRLVLDQLEAGMMTLDNAVPRVRMVAAMLKTAAQRDDAAWINLGIARLTADLGTEDRTFAVVVSHYLARMLDRAVTLGVPSQNLFDWVTGIPGVLGERLACRVLALADDIPVRDKIDHVTRRLASSTASGDDHDLVTAVVDAVAGDADLSRFDVWADALGTPSDPPDDPVLLPRDWSKAWRWSAVLPAQVLARWQDPIAAVTAQHGTPDPALFNHRTPRCGQPGDNRLTPSTSWQPCRYWKPPGWWPVWRPDPDSDLRMISARETARTLQAVVKAHPQRWVADPVAVVKTLREPVYVLHYLDGLAEAAADIASRTGDVLAAAQLATTERWTPTVLGNDSFDFEPDWHTVDTAVVDLLATLANQDAPFADHLDTAWAWTLAAIDTNSTTDTDARDPLNQAINSRHGRGLRTILALAHWERRHAAAIRQDFFDILDEVINLTEPVGMEYRAILAADRLVLERIAPEWLTTRADTLFRTGDLGPATLDLTLKYSRRATPWLLQTLREEIIAAAHRGADNAVATLLIGILDNEPGYDIATIINVLRATPAALTVAAETMASLVQDIPADSPGLNVGVQFWKALLDADRQVVPATVLHATGRWALVTGILDSTWTSLTLQTLTITAGVIDDAIEVAERCESAPIPGDSTRVLLLLLGHGEPWEQGVVAQSAIKALRFLSSTRQDDNFLALRTKLIELGYNEAADLNPYANPQ